MKRGQQEGKLINLRYFMRDFVKPPPREKTIWVMWRRRPDSNR